MPDGIRFETNGLLLLGDQDSVELAVPGLGCNVRDASTRSARAGRTVPRRASSRQVASASPRVGPWLTITTGNERAGAFLTNR